MPLYSQPLRKRPRVSLACTNCRKRKSRCDGNRPNCSPCRELHTQCVYESPSVIEKQLSREALLRKVAHLESQLKAQRSEDIESMIDDSQSSPSSVTVGSQSKTGQGGTAVGEHDAIGVDALASSAFDEAPASDIGFFGSSSNHALFRNVSQSFSQLARRSQVTALNQTREIVERPKSDQAIFQPRMPVSSSHSRSLPAKDELIRLLERFFTTIGAIIPCIDQAAFLEHWREVSVDKTRVIPRTEHALLNIMMAHASATLPDGNPMLFYRQSSDLLDMQTVKSTDIYTVQTLLLLSIFQQNHQRSIESWTTHSLVVKAAFQLGIHSPAYYESADDRQVHKRLWYCIVNQDRLLAALLGRPFLIPPQCIRLSLPESFGITLNLAPQSRPSLFSSQNEFFNNLISVHAIQGSAVEILYDYNIDGPSQRSPREAVTARLALAMQLDEWRQGLQNSMQILQHLSTIAWLPETLESMRWSLILSTHYYFTCLLINAPVLKIALGETQKNSSLDAPPSMLQDAIEHVLRDDFVAAKTLQTLVHGLQSLGGSFVDSNGIWFLCNYSTFTIALHAFGLLLYLTNLKHKAAKVGLGVEEVRTLLNDSLDSLRLVGQASLMSQKARRCLLRFLDVFDSMNLDDSGSEQQTRQSHVSGVAGNLAEPVEELLPDFDFSQFITDTADEFLFQ